MQNSSLTAANWPVPHQGQQESHVTLRRAFLGRFHAEGLCTDLRKFIDGPSSYLSLPEELKSAIEAITYIAEALQAEKDYEAVSRYLHSFLKQLYKCFPLQFQFSSSSHHFIRPFCPLSAEERLAVCCHGSGPHVPLDFRHLHHSGHFGHFR